MNENVKDNDLFYICSLIENIARKTNNKKKYIVNMMGKEKINKVYSLASIYHCENIDKVSDELIKDGKYSIIQGLSEYPTYFDIGREYQRLIIGISNSEKD